MTEASTGSIPNARLFSLAISAFAVLAAEPLYLLVDTAVVGHLGTTALGALGIGATILSLVTLVGTFLEYGTTSRAARWFGAGRPEDGAVEGVQATWLAVIIGVVAVGLGELFAGPLCRALAGGSGPIASHAEAWLRIAIGGVPGILIVLAGNGWLRGVQDTRSPVLIVLAANAVSAIASPILVYPFGLGLVGSAVANLGAQIIASVLFVRALLHRRVALRPNRAVMSAQLVMGRDLFLRAAAFQAAFLTSAAVAARMGSAQLGAHQIALQLWEFSALLLDAFAIAAQSLIGAALGGGRRCASPDDGLAGRSLRRLGRPGLRRSDRRGRLRVAAGVHLVSGGDSSGPHPVALVRRHATGGRFGLRVGRRVARRWRCRLHAHAYRRRRPGRLRTARLGRAALALGDRRGLGRIDGLHCGAFGRRPDSYQELRLDRYRNATKISVIYLAQRFR